MNYLTNYILSSSNYNVINMNNLFNFLIDLLKESDEATQIKIITSIKIHLGMSLYSNFKIYVYKKIPKDHIIKLLD